MKTPRTLKNKTIQAINENPNEEMLLLIMEACAYKIQEVTDDKNLQLTMDTVLYDITVKLVEINNQVETK